MSNKEGKRGRKKGGREKRLNREKEVQKGRGKAEKVRERDEKREGARETER